MVLMFESHMEYWFIHFAIVCSSQNEYFKTASVMLIFMISGPEKSLGWCDPLMS